MTAIGVEQPTSKGSGRTFYTVMAALIALVVAAGFGPSYSSSLAPPGLPWWVHLHGAAMTAWIVLFAAQAWLIGRRELKLHRNLGVGGMVLAVAIVPLGFATSILCARRGATPPFFTPAQMMADDMVDVVVFLALVGAAVAMRRRGEWHKRLLLTATVLLSWPALGRLVGHWGHSLSAVIPVSTALLMALCFVGPAFDLFTRRVVHQAYFWGIGAVILAQPVHAVVSMSEPMRVLAQSLSA